LAWVGSDRRKRSWKRRKQKESVQGGKEKGKDEYPKGGKGRSKGGGKSKKETRREKKSKTGEVWVPAQGRLDGYDGKTMKKGTKEWSGKRFRLI